MDRNQEICMGCMAPLNAGVRCCPRCSYDNAVPNPRDALPAGTILGDGYTIGRVVRQNDLTITYLALHTPKNVKVYIEEFYPAPMVERDSDGATLWVSEENRIRFKTLYSDIADRWKRLSKLDSRSLTKIRELFPALGTIYCVTTYMPYHTLEQQMQETGPMPWGEAKATFLPLCTLLSNLHNQGLTHCGVAPDNILVNRRGQLLLTGFALPELRTEGSGLTPELYSGYSAPEQYSKNLWQGEWTDVYSLGAVLYYIVTGTAPISALERAKKDTLPDAAALNPAVPDNVSEALVKAMEPTKQKRFSSVNELTAALLQETTSNTAVFRPEPIKPETKVPKGQKGSQKLGAKLPIVAILTTLLVFSLIGNLTLGSILWGGQVSAPPEDVSSQPVPELMTHNFTGVYLNAVMGNRTAYGDLIFETEYAYNEDYPADIIYDQSIKVGEALPENKTILLKVSRGSAYLTMPYLIGSSANFASKTLTDLGVSFEFLYDTNPESTGIVGTVTATNKGFGAKISRDADQVILTIKQPPPESIEP
ncbi:MAG: protein kinase [Angelakisella sp.]